MISFPDPDLGSWEKSAPCRCVRASVRAVSLRVNPYSDYTDIGRTLSDRSSDITIAAATNYGKLLTRSYWLFAQRSRTSETQGLKWAAASVLGINEPDATVVQRHITPLLLITAVAVTLDQHGCNMCVFLHIKNL